MLEIRQTSAGFAVFPNEGARECAYIQRKLILCAAFGYKSHSSSEWNQEWEGSQLHFSLHIVFYFGKHFAVYFFPC